MLLLLQTTTPEATTAPGGATEGTGGESTVVLDPAQVQTLIEHQAANTYAVMLGIGLLLLFVSALVFIEVNKGR